MFFTTRPRYVIKNGINLKLPSTAKIEKYSFRFEWLFLQSHFNAKVSIPIEDKQYIIDQLESFRETKWTDEHKPNFKNACKWWDMDDGKVEDWYFYWFKGKIIKTNTLYVFILEETDGMFYLYISY